MTTEPSIILLGASGGVFAVLFVLGFLIPPTNPIKTLTRAYLRLSHVPRGQARTELAERVELLSQRFPGKTHRWYLDWLVTDLKRAKR